MRTALILFVVAGLSACGHPHTLGPDHTESYTAAFTTQADLTRSSAVDDQYALSGFEAIEIRLRVQEASTDEAEATPEAASTFSVE